MTSGRFLLDTNVAIPFLARDENVVRRFDTSIEVFIPSIVIGELYYGAYNSARPAENVRKVSEFALSVQRRSFCPHPWTAMRELDSQTLVCRRD